MTDKDLFEAIKSEIKRIDVEIERGHSDLTGIKEILARIFEKLEQHKQEITECKKDIEHQGELFSNTLDAIVKDITKDMKEFIKDTDDLWTQFRAYKGEVKALRGWLYILIIGLLTSIVGNLVLMYISKGG